MLGFFIIILKPPFGGGYRLIDTPSEERQVMEANVQVSHVHSDLMATSSLVFRS